VLHDKSKYHPPDLPIKSTKCKPKYYPSDLPTCIELTNGKSTFHLADLHVPEGKTDIK
jgi:hypothetical protein